MKKHFNKNTVANIVLMVLILTCMVVIGIRIVKIVISVGQNSGEDPCFQDAYNPACTYEDLKPVIYLYPESEQEVKVKLDYDGVVFASWPEYLNGGWKVRAHPDGKIVLDEWEYSNLFWEGSPNKERTYDWSTGFSVRGSDSREFLREKLAEIGLAPREYNEFITYWYPKMQKNEWNLVHFAYYDEYDQYAKLKIDPAPDTLLRVFMVLRAIEVPVSVKPQVFNSFRREGFVVVEWGGTELR